MIALHLASDAAWSSAFDDQRLPPNRYPRENATHQPRWLVIPRSRTARQDNDLVIIAPQHPAMPVLVSRP